MVIEIIGGLGWLLASALSGVVGNRTDAGLRSAYTSIVEVLKKGGKPLNYDLQIAVQRSYLQSIQVICRECLVELKNGDTIKTDDATSWLERKIESLGVKLKEVKNLEYKETSIEQFQEIELLLTPEGKLADEKIRAFRIKIIDAVAEEDGAPVLFRKMVKKSLFEYMCGFFANEIKTNSKVRDVFVTHLLVQMDITLEGLNLTVDRLEAALREIADAAKEVGKSFLTVEEIKKNSDFKPIFISNYKFVGRSNELNRLEEFLNYELKIMAVIGEGGIGKTRLVIEFAKKIVEEGDWDVYFVNPDGNPHSNLNRLHGKKILLILDEAGSCTDKDKLIDSVLNNYSKEMQIKLLLIVRPIFKNSIESYLKKKSVSIQSVFIEPKKGDIVRFLRENCTWITEDITRIINERSFGSFNAAVAIAEYYREKGNIADVQEALSWQAEKYIRDIAIGVGKNPDDIAVASTVRLISLITPVAWEEKEYLRKLPPYIYPIDPESLENVLRISSFSRGVVSYFPEEKVYAIKPDPLADHLRMELMKNEDVFTRIWKNLLPYMAYRISENIAVLPMDNLELLDQIWNELNIIKGSNVEYFKAIVFFTGDLAQIADINILNINHWIKCSHNLSSSSQETEVREALAKGLVNAGNLYGTTQKFEKMEDCLQDLRNLHIKHPDTDVRVELAKGLINAENLYGTTQKFEKMEDCLQELRNLHIKHPDTDVRVELAKGLYNAVTHYGRAQNIEKIEECLQEFRDLHIKHPYKEVRDMLASGLYNVLIVFKRKCYENLVLLYKLRFDLPDDPDRHKRNKLIEEMFVEETVKISESEYNKGAENFKVFLQKIKTELGDDTDVVLLMDKVAEKLPLKAQKVMFETYSY